MAETARQTLRDSGLKADRLALEWASAAEGPRFVELVTGYVAKIRAIGPFGQGEGEADPATLKRRLRAACRAAQVPKVRTAIGNLAKKMREQNDYSIYTQDAISKDVAEKVLPVFHEERVREEVLSAMADRDPHDAPSLKDLTGASDEVMDKILQGLLKKGVLKEGSQGLVLAGNE
jgi:hypothetical protein